jgi:hypothetical protein
MLPHLHSGWAVDQAILAEEERLVVIRFGHDWDETCMQVFIHSFINHTFCYFNLFFFFFSWLIAVTNNHFSENQFYFLTNNFLYIS